MLRTDVRFELVNRICSCRDDGINQCTIADPDFRVQSGLLHQERCFWCGRFREEGRQVISRALVPTVLTILTSFVPPVLGSIFAPAFFRSTWSTADLCVCVKYKWLLNWEAELVEEHDEFLKDALIQWEGNARVRSLYILLEVAAVLCVKQLPWQLLSGRAKL